MALNIPNPTSDRMHCNPRFISFFLHDENVDVDDFRFLNRFLSQWGIQRERERERDQGCQMAKFDPFLFLPSTLVQSKERKGSNFAV